VALETAIDKIAVLKSSMDSCGVCKCSCGGACADKIAVLRSNLVSSIKERDRLKRIAKHKDSMLAYYTNANTPSSAEFLQWKRRKRVKRKENEGKNNSDVQNRDV